jgi:hypothetical protein
MKQDVKVQKLHIKQQGERHYFQMNLPRAASKIIGIELGSFFKEIPIKKDIPNLNRGIPFFANPLLARPKRTDNRLSVRRNKLCGTIQLQTNNKSNFFFSGELIQEDANGVFTPISPYENSYTRPIWNSKTFSVGGTKEVEEVLIEKEKVIYGCYKDAIGITKKKNVEYTVMLYVWYES